MKVVAKTKGAKPETKQTTQFLCKLSTGEAFQCASLLDANRRVEEMNEDIPGPKSAAPSITIKEFYEIRPVTNLVEQQKAAERMREIATLRREREELLEKLETVRKRLKKLGLKR